MITKRKLTVDDVFVMGEAGLIANDERVELVEGELYTMTPPSSRHAAVVDALHERFLQAYQKKAIVRSQNPVVLSDHNLYEPDVALLKYRQDRYVDAHPGARDIFFVVEVSLTSLRFDRETKLPNYAEAGIPEVWLVNLESNQVEVYSGPTGRSYRYRSLFYPGEPVVPLAFPDSAGVVVLW